MSSLDTIEPTTKHASKVTADAVSSAAATAADAARDAGEKVLDVVSDSARNVTDAVSSTVADALDDVKSRGRKLRRQAKSKARKQQRRSTKKARAMSKSAVSTWTGVADEASKRATDVVSVAKTGHKPRGKLFWFLVAAGVGGAVFGGVKYTQRQAASKSPAPTPRPVVNA